MYGDADDFQALLDYVVAIDPAHSAALPARVLWRVRDRLGRLFDLGRISVAAEDRSNESSDERSSSGDQEASLTTRLPRDLRNSAGDLGFSSLPFVPLYRTDDEFAAEISNRTVHGVMHLAWAEQGQGRYQGQMAVYVKPRGRLGSAYMAFIKPFRYLIVYPALLRQIEREWVQRRPAA